MSNMNNNNKMMNNGNDKMMINNDSNDKNDNDKMMQNDVTNSNNNNRQMVIRTTPKKTPSNSIRMLDTIDLLGSNLNTNTNFKSEEKSPFIKKKSRKRGYSSMDIQNNTDNIDNANKDEMNPTPKKRYKEFKMEEFEVENDNVDGDDDDEFGVLLEKLAGINIPNKKDNCPLCYLELPLSKFPIHVYKCVEKYDDKEKKQQIKRDEDLAKELQRTFQDPNIKGNIFKDIDQQQCPICFINVANMDLNQHVNKCLDSSMKEGKKEEDVDIIPEHPKSLEKIAFTKASDLKKGMIEETEKDPDVGMIMNHDQMVAAAHAVLDRKKEIDNGNGEGDIGDLLSSFKRLGLNKANMKKTLSKHGKTNK